jgi:hypothetical protein
MMPGKANTPTGYIEKEQTPSTMQELGGQIANPLQAPMESFLRWLGSPEQSRKVIVWAIVAVLFVVGIWGLIAPGGGVAIIERARR